MEKTLYIKNMVCDRCIKVLKNELKDEGIKVLNVKLGELTVNIDSKDEIPALQKIIESNGSAAFWVETVQFLWNISKVRCCTL